MIVTFLAILEMIRLKLIRVFQQDPPGRSASTSALAPRMPRIRSTIRRTREDRGGFQSRTRPTTLL